MLNQIRDALRHAPDPEDAQRWLERLVGAGLDDRALSGYGDVAAQAVRIACAQAPYLAMLAARDLRRLERVLADPFLRREKPRARMARELGAALAGVKDEELLIVRLRAWRAQEIIRLGLRECGLGQAAEVWRELAHLADVALDAALAFHDAELARIHGEPTYVGDDGRTRRARLAVMGMGKLGGEELNFASDIDVIYVYPSDEGQAGKLSLHEYFNKLALKLTRALAEVTEDEWVFRVDLRLRPEGSRGPLVNSLAAIERYYESWGRPWERQAWLKARTSAGDLSVGEEALRILAPFIYPRHTSPSVIQEVTELNRKIKAELDQATLGGGFDVKLGEGGIREVEFFVQALQLIHAGKNPMLRERGTRRGLERLVLAGLLSERERALLIDAYDFLRQTEHLLQLDSGRQTHRLPGDAHGVGVIARRLGLPDAGEFLGRLELHTSAVAQLFSTLGEPTAPPKAISVLLDPERGEEPTRAALAELGFADPAHAWQMLELLRRKPLSPFGPAASPVAAGLAPVLLKEIAASPDPDQALGSLVDLAGLRAGQTALWTLLDANPRLLRLLVSLLGTSAFLGRTLVEQPELIDGLLDAAAGAARNRMQLEVRVDDALSSVPAGDDEQLWDVLRRAQRQEILRIGLADVAGDLDVVEVGQRLSDLADTCVARTLESVRASLLRRTPRLPPVAVLGLGKLGARELGYGADLDLVFVYDGDVDDHEPASRLAQRLTNALAANSGAGRLYEVDTRLRPSGRQGTLVSSLAGWTQYHEQSSALWERQALTRLRAVAGDAALGHSVEDAALRACYEGPALPAAQLVAELGAMRTRIEKELAQERAGHYDLKGGRGGLIDIEFAAQFLQLLHGPSHPALRVRGTLAALDAAASAGLLADDARTTLVSGWLFLRKLEHRLRIVHDRAVHVLPSGAELETLARRMAYPSAGALERAYLVWTRDVRACYARLLEQNG